MTLVKEKTRDYDTIDRIKELMRLSNLTLEDIAPHVPRIPRKKSAEDTLKRIAGSWKHKDIDSLLVASRHTRAQLPTL